MGRLNFQVDTYTYDPSNSRLNRFRNPFKPPDTLGLSDGSFRSGSVQKEDFSYKPFEGRTKREPTRSSSVPTTQPRINKGEDLNDSSASTLSFRSLRNGSFSHPEAGEVIRNSPPDSADQKTSNSRKSVVMVYNPKKSMFEETGNNKKHLLNARTATLTPPHGIEPVNTESRDSFGTREDPYGRPKPKYNARSSSLHSMGGIEYDKTESKEQFEMVTRFSGYNRGGHFRNLRDSTIDRSKGIEEKESEYKNRFSLMDHKDSKLRPNWYTWDGVRSPYGTEGKHPDGLEPVNNPA